MNTPEEKAKELVNIFTWQRDEHEKYVAKESAKSCVDEIINSQPTFPTEGYYENYHDRADDAKVWWLNVRNEIEKIDLYPTI